MRINTISTSDRVTIETPFDRDHLLRVTQAGNRLTHSSQTAFGNVGIYDYEYQSNKQFNVTEEDQVTDTYQIDKLEAVRTYGYDMLDRLTSAALTDSSDWSAVATQTTTWSSLDDLGNWLTHSDRGATAINRTFDKANRMNDWGIVNTNTLHNAAGNQVKLPTVAGDALHPVVYDHLNRLTAVRNAPDTQNTGTFDYDALGRRILVADGRVPDLDRWYYYDGVNEILEAADSGATVLRWYVHGVSYIDERLMMYAEYDVTGTNAADLSYFYAIDRMYNVRMLLDATGAILESYAYDPYGEPLIRECAGRGDMSGDSIVSKDGDEDAFLNALSCSTFDPRADVDDDGEVDQDDAALYDAKIAIWDGGHPQPVKTARSLIGNPYMFQGRPNFVFGSDIGGENPKFTLNDHRSRFVDPMTGRWMTRDSSGYIDGYNLFAFAHTNPVLFADPLGAQSTQPSTQPASQPASQPTEKSACDKALEEVKNSAFYKQYKALSEKNTEDCPMPEMSCAPCSDPGPDKPVPAGQYDWKTRNLQMCTNARKIGGGGGLSQQEFKENVEHELWHALQDCTIRINNRTGGKSGRVPPGCPPDKTIDDCQFSAAVEADAYWNTNNNAGGKNPNDPAVHKARCNATLNGCRASAKSCKDSDSACKNILRNHYNCKF
ncbi:MAG: hypothetical protein KF841_15540 [Phycisphaerae bacterium]|nr:hypothetical protein [Phycisphaerae bacterium]